MKISKDFFRVMFYVYMQSQQTHCFAFVLLVFILCFLLLSFLNLLLSIYISSIDDDLFSSRRALSINNISQQDQKSRRLVLFPSPHGDRPAPRFVLSRLVVVVMVSSTRHVPYFHPVGFIRRV